jgi:hypothetical protein
MSYEMDRIISEKVRVEVAKQMLPIEAKIDKIIEILGKPVASSHAPSEHSRSVNSRPTFTQRNPVEKEKTMLRVKCRKCQHFGHFARDCQSQSKTVYYNQNFN